MTGRVDPTFRYIEIGGQRLRSAAWGSGEPDLILLHDGLGSIPQWRGLPGAVSERTGRTVLAYERAGHGQSTPVPTGPWPNQWLRHEAAVLQQLIDQVTAAAPIVVGMSDGGSTALLHALRPDARVAGVLTLAAHTWVEQICFDAIVDMRANRSEIEAGLARYHDAPQAIFEAWSGVWVSDDFRSWDIRPEIGAITAPTLIAQGSEDPYATEAHAHISAEAIGDNARSHIVPDVGHIMHRDDERVVVDLICEFVATVS